MELVAIAKHSILYFFNRSITDYMTQEGIVYTSVDSDHFLCVDT